MTITEKIINNFKANADAHNAIMQIIGRKDNDRNTDIITEVLIDEMEDRLKKNSSLFETISNLEPSAIAAMSSDIESTVMKIVRTQTYVNYHIEKCAVAAARDVLHF